MIFPQSSSRLGAAGEGGGIRARPRLLLASSANSLVRRRPWGGRQGRFLSSAFLTGERVTVDGRLYPQDAAEGGSKQLHEQSCTQFNARFTFSPLVQVSFDPLTGVGTCWGGWGRGFTHAVTAAAPPRQHSICGGGSSQLGSIKTCQRGCGSGQGSKVNTPFVPRRRVLGPFPSAKLVFNPGKEVFGWVEASGVFRGVSPGWSSGHSRQFPSKVRLRGHVSGGVAAQCATGPSSRSAPSRLLGVGRLALVR